MRTKTNTIDPKSPWSNGRTEAGINKLVQPECNYCNKAYGDMGKVRPHLRLHIGIRPYKCNLCEYRHWDKSNLLSNHFINVHEKLGKLTDIDINADEEKRLEKCIEEDVQEIRDNQMRKHKGEPVNPKKKIPNRDVGLVYHENRYAKFKYSEANTGIKKDGGENNNNNEKKETSSNEIPLAAKLSQAVNDQKTQPLTPQNEVPNLSSSTIQKNDSVSSASATPQNQAQPPPTNGSTFSKSLPVANEPINHQNKLQNQNHFAIQQNYTTPVGTIPNSLLSPQTQTQVMNGITTQKIPTTPIGAVNLQNPFQNQNPNNLTMQPNLTAPNGHLTSQNQPQVLHQNSLSMQGLIAPNAQPIMQNQFQSQTTSNITYQQSSAIRPVVPQNQFPSQNNFTICSGMQNSTNVQNIALQASNYFQNNTAAASATPIFMGNQNIGFQASNPYQTNFNSQAGTLNFMPLQSNNFQASNTTTPQLQANVSAPTGPSNFMSIQNKITSQNNAFQASNSTISNVPEKLLNNQTFGFEPNNNQTNTSTQDYFTTHVLNQTNIFGTTDVSAPSKILSLNDFSIDKLLNNNPANVSSPSVQGNFVNQVLNQSNVINPANQNSPNDVQSKTELSLDQLLSNDF